MEEPRNSPCNGRVGLQRTRLPWHAPVWVPGWLYIELVVSRDGIRIEGRDGSVVV